MKEIVNFLVEVNKLKEMPRTGWVLRKVKDPETVAEHSFRLALMAWFFAEKKNLNVKRAIKVALSHDLCEVYAGDITPFLYYPRLPKGEEERKKALMKWSRLYKKDKEKIGKMKFKKEKASLLKLLKHMPPSVRNEILSMWLGYEGGTSREGKFVNQLNRVETLIQSIEFFGTNDAVSGTNWWEWAEEIVDDKSLLEFLKVIQKKLYKKKVPGHETQKDLESILNFSLIAGKLKSMPRLYWKIRNVKNPETVAGHIFTLAIMAWIFGSHKKKFDVEKLLKMALLHEMTAVYTGDTTPYDKILPKDERQRTEMLKKMVRLPKDEKRKIFFHDYKEEKKAVEKLVIGLKPSLKKEIVQLWKEYRTKSTPEGCFLSQLNVLAVLLQALIYEEKNKKFSAGPLWEWAYEFCDAPIFINFMEALSKRFYGK